MADRTELVFRPDPRRFWKRLGLDFKAAAARHFGDELENIGRAFELKVKFGRLEGGPTASKLGTRTGALKQSLGHKTLRSVELDQMKVHVGFGPPANPWAGAAGKYAPVHEGLVPMPIRPKRRKFLSIPVQRTAGGDVSGAVSPTQLANARFVPWVFRTGPGFLVFDGGLLRFLLVRQVTIPARLNFRKDWADFRPEAQARLDAALGRAIAETND